MSNALGRPTIDSFGQAHQSSITNQFSILIRSWESKMRRLVFGFLITAVFAANTALGQHAFTPEEIAEGGRLFQSNCTGCHGSAGDQVQGVSLMSGKFRRATNDDEVAGIIRKGVPGTAMQAFNFTDQQAGMIVAYLKAFSTTGTSISAADAP